MNNFKLIEKRLSLKVTTILEQNAAIFSGLEDCQNTLSKIQKRTNSIETKIQDQRNKNSLAQANVQTKEQFNPLSNILFYPNNNNNNTAVALATLAQDPANPTKVLLPFPWYGNVMSYGYANGNPLLLPTPRPFTVEGLDYFTPSQPQPNQTHDSVGDGIGEENFEDIRKEQELNFGNHKIGKTTTKRTNLLSIVDSIDLGRDISNPHNMRYNMNVEKNKDRDLHPTVSVDIDNNQNGNSNNNSWNSLSSNANDNDNDYDDSEEYSLSVSNSSSSDSISVTSVDREYNYSSQRKQKKRDIISAMSEISSITVSLEM